jgi:hypothetical protein
MAPRSELMIETTRRNIPEDHPIRKFFHTLTERSFEVQHLHDEETIQYITNLLTDFVDIENTVRIKDDAGRRIENLFDILRQADAAMSPQVRRDYYKHLGDVTLFNLGLFPEHLTHGRHTVSPDFYAEQGRRSYDMVAAIDKSRATAIFRKLSAQFEQCVIGLNWVKVYINDPFYQYVFREFGVT